MKRPLLNELEPKQIRSLHWLSTVRTCRSFGGYSEIISVTQAHAVDRERIGWIVITSAVNCPLAESVQLKSLNRVQLVETVQRDSQHRVQLLIVEPVQLKSQDRVQLVDSAQLRVVEPLHN